MGRKDSDSEVLVSIIRKSFTKERGWEGEGTVGERMCVQRKGEWEQLESPALRKVKDDSPVRPPDLGKEGALVPDTRLNPWDECTHRGSEGRV